MTIQEFRHYCATEIMGWEQTEFHRIKVYCNTGSEIIRFYTPDTNIEQAVELWNALTPDQQDNLCQMLMIDIPKDTHNIFQIRYYVDFLFNPLKFCKALADAEGLEVDWNN